MAGEAELIGAIGDLFYGKPKRLAVGVDADNNLIDANGNKTTFYAEPGKGAKFFSQNARRAAQVNEQFDTANIQNKLEEGQRWNSAKHLVDTLPSNMWTQTESAFAVPSDGTVGPVSPLIAHDKARNYLAATVLHDALNPTTQLNRNAAMATLNNGLVGQQAALDANNAFANSQLAASDLAFKGQQQGAEQAYQRDTLALAQKKLSELSPIELANAKAEAYRVYGDKATLDDIYTAANTLRAKQIALEKTQTANAQNIADIDAANAGLIGNTRSNELTGNYFKSRYGISPLEYQQTPHVPVIVDGNIVLPSVNAPAHEGYINPTTEALNQAKELTSAGATPTITSSGSPYLKPPSTKPTIITAPRDYGNHELRIDAHNEGVKAKNEAEIAEHEAEIAAVEARKKQLKARIKKITSAELAPQIIQTSLTPSIGELIGSATSNIQTPHPINYIKNKFNGYGGLIGQ